jgi:predicted permease
MADNIAHGWALLVLPVVNVGVGLLLGYINTCFFRPPENFRRAAIAAVAFGNSTTMPSEYLSKHVSSTIAWRPGGVIFVALIFVLCVFLSVHSYPPRCYLQHSGVQDQPGAHRPHPVPVRLPADLPRSHVERRRSLDGR